MTIVFITVSVNGKKSKPSAAVGASFQIGVDRKAVYTAESKAKIDDARTAYNGLTQTQKALVANYGVLEAAEARYADLKAAAEAPTNPTNPDQPSGGSGKCKWCGKDHTANFWQRIVGFWHTIFYFWAHLFGLK